MTAIIILGKKSKGNIEAETDIIINPDGYPNDLDSVIDKSVPGRFFPRSPYNII